MKISKFKEKLLYCMLIATIVLLMYFLKIPCFFKLIFGIPCPGCGITRAYISVLHLDFKRAFSFNPMFWSAPVLLFLYLFEDSLTKARWILNSIFGLIIAGFFINWIFVLTSL